MSELSLERTPASSRPRDWKSSWLPRIGGLIELAIFALTIAVVDHFAFPASNLYSVTPNPYWLPIILLTLQHGTATGLVSALFASAMYFSYGTNQPAAGTTQVTELLQLVLEPLLWTIAAVFFGSLRSQRIELESTLSCEVEELRERNGSLVKHCQALHDKNDNLQKELALKHCASVEDTHAAIRKIQKASVHELQDAAAKAVSLLLGGVKFSIFVCAETGLELHGAWGWSANEIRRRHYLENDPLFDLVINQRRLLSSSRKIDRESLAAHGVLAGPIITPERQVIGMLKIEEVSSEAVSREMTVTFSYLCREIGQVFGRQHASRTTAPLVQRIRGLIREQQGLRVAAASFPDFANPGPEAANDDK